VFLGISFSTPIKNKNEINMTAAPALVAILDFPARADASVIA
jgi:hypothetical protein